MWNGKILILAVADARRQSAPKRRLSRFPPKRLPSPSNLRNCGFRRLQCQGLRVEAPVWQGGLSLDRLKDEILNAGDTRFLSKGNALIGDSSTAHVRFPRLCSMSSPGVQTGGAVLRPILIQVVSSVWLSVGASTFIPTSSCFPERPTTVIGLAAGCVLFTPHSYQFGVSQTRTLQTTHGQG